MLSPAGEGILTDFCASLFRFQGAAARHCRSWLHDPGAARQGQTEPTLVPETLIAQGSLSWSLRGVRVNPAQERRKNAGLHAVETGL